MDCWNRPISSNAGATIDIIDRERKTIFDNLKENGKVINAINMGSYNYLGFGEPDDLCTEYVYKILTEYGISTVSPTNEYGYLKIHRELENIVAEFIGKEDAICFPMGFATNSGNIQAFLDNKCCIVSDELNHASIVLGSRLSNCKIFTFKHNDMEHLETILREIIIQGRGKTHRDWNKIILIVEGIYSMEGTYIDLPAIVELKKKYKFYIYLDEAHSIGCTGTTGRGVTEFFNIDLKYIDVMMGTFTKSFGSCGGYIAADKKIIDFVREKSYCCYYGVSIAPAVCAQIIASICVLTGKIGNDIGKIKLLKLRENILYFRSKLKRMGFIIYGHDYSPVVPLMIYIPGQLSAFSRLMLEHNVAVVVVGFPATSILSSRARFCISSCHNKEMLDHVLNAIDIVGTRIGMKYKI
ncbi:hypothetical protein HZS_2107 [Henneguya salminicola]|nr:hypothetical protein HZS_2107 [Henneguya salminicola]